MSGRDHAFGGACVYLRPAVLRKNWIVSLVRSPLRTVKNIASLYLSPARSRVSAAWKNLSCHATFDESLRIGPNAWCSNHGGKGRTGDISFGAHAVFRGVIRVELGGKVTIGSHVYVGDDVIISSACGISVGSHSEIAHGVHIFDNDSHPLEARARRRHTTSYYANDTTTTTGVSAANVIIGEDVWIGFNAFIAKGVSIGDGSVIAACSVVTKTVPPGVLVGGNPARVIRYLE